MPRWHTLLAAALVISLMAIGCAAPQIERREADLVPPSPTPVRVYVVKPGDTLYTIAARFDTTTEALSTVNSLPSPNLIPVGLQLTIPRADEAHASLGGPLNLCEGYRLVASQIGGLLAQLRSGVTDFGAALRTVDRLNAELQQLPRTIPAYQALESAINGAAVTASAASLGRSSDANSAVQKARTYLDSAVEDLAKCALGEPH